MNIPELKWESIGDRDIQALTEFGTYTISVDSAFTGSTHYLWTPVQGESDDCESEHTGMRDAKNSAQFHYSIMYQVSKADEPEIVEDVQALKDKIEELENKLHAISRLSMIADDIDAQVKCTRDVLRDSYSGKENQVTVELLTTHFLDYANAIRKAIK